MGRGNRGARQSGANSAQAGEGQNLGRGGPSQPEASHARVNGPDAFGDARNWMNSKGAGKGQASNTKDQVPPPPKLDDEAEEKARQGGLHTQLRKTKICMYHLRGACQYGRDCAFAHSCSELQANPDLSKTRLCKAYAEGGCTDRDCTFAHGEEELRSTNMFYKKTLCIWNEKSKCRNGDGCRFAHGSVELRAGAGGQKASEAAMNAEMQHLHQYQQLQQYERLQQQQHQQQQQQQHQQQQHQQHQLQQHQQLLAQHGDLSAAQAAALLFSASGHGASGTNKSAQQDVPLMPDQQSLQMQQLQVQQLAQQLKQLQQLKDLQQLKQQQQMEQEHVDQQMEYQNALNQAQLGGRGNVQFEPMKINVADHSQARHSAGGYNAMQNSPMQNAKGAAADVELKNHLDALKQKISMLTMRCNQIQNQMTVIHDDGDFNDPVKLPQDFGHLGSFPLHPRQESNSSAEISTAMPSSTPSYSDFSALLMGSPTSPQASPAMPAFYGQQDVPMSENALTEAHLRMAAARAEAVAKKMLMDRNILMAALNKRSGGYGGQQAPDDDALAAELFMYGQS